jgi:Ca2+:H+ antiporter
MGRATEELAARAGSKVGGLLNATFGNAAELIIALVALSAGKIEVVKASITGSILSNLLLVLGLSIFMGGLRYSTQRFNAQAAGVMTSLLTLTLTQVAT